MPPRPHVLFLTSDQLRADALGAYRAGDSLTDDRGGTVAVNATTPHLNALAQRGVRFSNAFTAAPECVPARATWLTSRYPAVHGAMNNGMARRPLRAPSLYRAAADAGYVVAMLGKTHYQPALTEDDRVSVMWHYVVSNATSAEDRWRAPNRTMDTTLEGVLVKAFAGFLGYQAHEAPHRPWFVHLSFVNPHPPIDCARLPRGRSNLHWTRSTPPLVQADELQGNERFGGNVTLYQRDWRRRRRCYGATVEYVDSMAGRALALVDLATTLVVFTSDHGDMLGAHGIAQKSVFYEAAWRVPLLVAGPGVPRGRVDGGFACGVDVPATLRAAMRARGSELGVDLRSGAARTGCPGWMGADLQAYVNATEKRVYKNGRLVQRFARPGDPDELENLALTTTSTRDYPPTAN